MKNKITLIVAIGSLLLFSCSKNNTTTPIGELKARPNVHTMADGEDGDIIIINHKIVDIKGSPISGATVTIINGTDTLTGTTDSYGRCKTYPTHLGTWNLNVVQSSYLPLNTQIQLIDSVSCITSILQLP